jgi:TPR repeat protein
MEHTLMKQSKNKKFLLGSSCLLAIALLVGCADNFNSETKAAEQGDPKAQANLSSLYYEGKGVTKSYKQAFKWSKKAAEQGNVLAQFHLALMYYKGEGVTQDYKQAFKWCKKAAEQGDSLCQFHIALMYQNGQGVAQNYKKSYVWFELAFKNGLPDARMFRDIVAKKLSPEAVKSAKEEVRQLSDKIK